MHEDPDLWDAGAPDFTGPRGIYIAISGNTAAGKSTLIRASVTRAKELGQQAIGISERSFHHPYLKRMFADPANYAFGIQLNFMLQRHLALQTQLALGRVVIIERSHFDDDLFLREHVDSGSVAQDQYDAYVGLAKVLNARLPAPDLLVLLNPAPELSLSRLKAAELSGERPEEFPSEEAKEAWVRRWHRMYIDLHREFIDRARDDRAFADTRILTLDTNASVQQNVERLLEALHLVLSKGARTMPSQHAVAAIPC